MKLSLPVPPSTNALYATVGKRRIKTAEYKAWIQEAGYRANGVHEKFECPVLVCIWLSRSSGMDLGNCEKATTDLLVRHKIIPDDKQKYVDGINLRWHTEGDEMFVEIETV